MISESKKNKKKRKKPRKSECQILVPSNFALLLQLGLSILSNIARLYNPTIENHMQAVDAVIKNRYHYSQKY